MIKSKKKITISIPKCLSDPQNNEVKVIQVLQEKSNFFLTIY